MCSLNINISFLLLLFTRFCLSSSRLLLFISWYTRSHRDITFCFWSIYPSIVLGYYRVPWYRCLAAGALRWFSHLLPTPGLPFCNCSISVWVVNLCLLMFCRFFMVLYHWVWVNRLRLVHIEYRRHTFINIRPNFASILGWNLF